MYKVYVYWHSRRNSDLLNGQNGLRNLGIKVWKIAVNFEKAEIVFAPPILY